MKLSLRALVVSAGALLGIAAVVACATDNSDAPAPAPPDNEIIPTPEAGADAGSAAASDAGCDGCAPIIDCSKTDFCAAAASISPSVSLNAIWGSSATDVWIVGSGGTILHGDGATFTAVTPATWNTDVDAGIQNDTIFFSVWGSAKDDVWIGATGAPLHYSVTGDAGAPGVPAWQVVPGAVWDSTSATQGRIAAIWGAAKDNVWLAGNPSSRFNGFGSFWSEGIDRGKVVWNAVDAFEGDNTVGTSIHALWGASASDVFAVGEAGNAFHLVPAAGKAVAHWDALDSFTTNALDGVWGSSPSDVWAVGGGGVLRHFTGDLTKGFASAPSPTIAPLHGIWGTTTSDVWAVGDHGTILHFDGHAWSLESTGLANQAPNLFAVWGSGPDDVWIAGEGVLLHRTAMNRRQP